MPTDIFKEYDVPVDIIVTPTEVIEVEKRLLRPKGIIWNHLSNRRINLMPILKVLLEIDEKLGKDVTLKELDSETETPSEPRRRYRYSYRRNRRRRENDSKSSEKENDTDKENVTDIKKRQRKRPTQRKEAKTEKETSDNVKKPDRKKRNFQKKQIDFSLIVRNIERSMRVRDMKDALNEIGVKPRVLTWRGFKGYCCLHFSKNSVAGAEETSNDLHNVDNVIGMLQNLKIQAQTDKQLAIEVMKPISRIETTDVTSI